MASSENQDFAVATVYATSLLTLAQQRNEEKDVGEEFEQLADALNNHPYLPSFLTSPTVDLKRRSETLEKMFRGRGSETFVDALQVLNRNGRLGLIRAISARYKALHQESLGRIKALVQSAVPLSPSHLTRLRDEFRKRTGKEVDFDARVEPELLGGMILQVGDKKVDASLSRKLRNLSEALLERGSREVLRADDYVARS